MGFAGALVSGSLVLVLLAVDGFVLKALADSWAAAPALEEVTALRIGAAFHEANIALFSLWIVLLAVTVFLYGFAMAISGVYPRLVGWLAVVAALGVGTVRVALVSGVSETLANVLFPTFYMTITAWALVVGVLLWRKSGLDELRANRYVEQDRSAHSTAT